MLQTPASTDTDYFSKMFVLDIDIIRLETRSYLFALCNLISGENVSNLLEQNEIDFLENTLQII